MEIRHIKSNVFAAVSILTAFTVAAGSSAWAPSFAELVALVIQFQ